MTVTTKHKGSRNGGVVILPYCLLKTDCTFERIGQLGNELFIASTSKLFNLLTALVINSVAWQFRSVSFLNLYFEKAFRQQTLCFGSIVAYIRPVHVHDS